MFSAEHEQIHKVQREAIPHEHALPPACSCSLHAGVSLGNIISKGKATALTTAQLRSCKHQQFSHLVGAFHFVLYFFPTFIKDQGKKEEANVYGTGTCSGTCIDSLNLTQFEVICVCMPPVTCLILLHFILEISVVLHSFSL